MSPRPRSWLKNVPTGLATGLTAFGMWAAPLLSSDQRAVSLASATINIGSRLGNAEDAKELFDEALAEKSEITSHASSSPAGEAPSRRGGPQDPVIQTDDDLGILLKRQADAQQELADALKGFQEVDRAYQIASVMADRRAAAEAAEDKAVESVSAAYAAKLSADRAVEQARAESAPDAEIADATRMAQHAQTEFAKAETEAGDADREFRAAYHEMELAEQDGADTGDMPTGRAAEQALHNKALHDVKADANPGTASVNGGAKSSGDLEASGDSEVGDDPEVGGPEVSDPDPEVRAG